MEEKKNETKRSWTRWVTPIQGYVAIILVAVAAAAEWGSSAGLGLAGGLLLLDAWRPWRRPPVIVRPDVPAKRSEP